MCMGGAGAEIFYQEWRRKKNIWSQSRGKMSRLSNTAFKEVIFFLNMTCGVTFSKFFEWEDIIQCQKLDLTKFFMSDF